MKANIFLCENLAASEAKEMTTKVPHSFLSYFCNFYSYLLFFPFKIGWCPVSNKFVLISSPVRKRMTCFANIVGIIATTPYLVTFVCNFNLGFTQPSRILSNLTSIISYSVGIDFVRIIWTKQEFILEVLNGIAKLKLYHLSLYKIGIVCLAPLLTVAINNPVAYQFDRLFGFPPPRGFQFVGSGLYSENNVFGYFYILLYVLFGYGHLYYIVSTGFVLALTLSIRESFIRLAKVKNEFIMSADVAIYKGLQIDRDIRDLIEKINKVVGSKVLFEYIMMLTFYASILDFFTNYSESEFYRAHVLYYLFFSGMFWITASEVHVLIKNYIKEYVYQYRSRYLLESPTTIKHYPLGLLALQSEADSNPPAIACRCFNITYAFLGTMLGLIVTYSTIVYQMKSEKI